MPPPEALGEDPSCLFQPLGPLGPALPPLPLSPRGSSPVCLSVSNPPLPFFYDSGHSIWGPPRESRMISPGDPELKFYLQRPFSQIKSRLHVLRTRARTYFFLGGDIIQHNSIIIYFDAPTVPGWADGSRYTLVSPPSYVPLPQEQSFLPGAAKLWVTGVPQGHVPLLLPGPLVGRSQRTRWSVSTCIRKYNTHALVCA